MKVLANIVFGSVIVLTMADCGSVSPETTGSDSLADTPALTFLCSPDTNGGTLVDGVCVLGGAVEGQPFEGFVMTNPLTVGFTITSGQLPPGLTMPSAYGVTGTIIAGTPTQEGTFTFTIHATHEPTADEVFRITVAPPAPLTITFPASCCSGGTVGSPYFQNFFSSGGIGPFTWTIAAGALPPGVIQSPPAGNHLGGTPTAAGTFTFTVRVSDAAGDQATEPGSITIAP